MTFDLSQYEAYKTKGLITSITSNNDIITVIYKSFDNLGNKTDITDNSNSILAWQAIINSWNTSISNLQASISNVQSALSDAS